MEVSQVLGCPLLSAGQGVALAAGMWRERQFLLRFPAPPPPPLQNVVTFQCIATVIPCPLRKEIPPSKRTFQKQVNRSVTFFLPPPSPSSFGTVQGTRAFGLVTSRVGS